MTEEEAGAHIESGASNITRGENKIEEKRNKGKIAVVLLD